MPLNFIPEDCLEYLVADSVGTEQLAERMRAGEKLVVKFGIDPTSKNVHLGRTIPLWRLRAFQELGHYIHLVIGDFTAQIGDTSDKESERPMLTPEQVHENLENYEKQLWMVLNPEKKDQVTFHYNSEWLGKLSFAEVSRLAGAFSVNQFIKRELVARRLEQGGRVSLREMLYPLMQGYDSVALQADVEIGGSDQWFNLLAGRTLQEEVGQPAQAIITNILINGTDGEKMSSSRGNVISLNQPAFGMFTQLMQINDGVLLEYLNVFPRSGRPFTPEELQQQFKAGTNPRDLKLKFATQLVSLLYGSGSGEEAKERWEREASERALPEDIAEFAVTSNQSLVHILVNSGLAASNSDARRLIEQGGVRLNGAVVQALDYIVTLSEEPLLLQVGKHRFLRLVQA